MNKFNISRSKDEFYHVDIKADTKEDLIKAFKDALDFLEVE